MMKLLPFALLLTLGVPAGVLAEAPAPPEPLSSPTPGSLQYMQHLERLRPRAHHLLFGSRRQLPLGPELGAVRQRPHDLLPGRLQHHQDLPLR